MPLDGLRAWIGEVERKLGMRTRVFLALSAIAIGGAGAAIYLAVDAQDNAVGQGDLQALQERLEAQSGASGEAAEVARLEAELKALRGEVEQLRSEGEKSGSGSKGSGKGGASSSNQPPSEGATGSANAGKLRELVEKAKQHAK
jgi:hypothetical protein